MRGSTRRAIIVMSIASILPAVTHALVDVTDPLSALTFLSVMLSGLIVTLDVLLIAFAALQWIDDGDS